MPIKFWSLTDLRVLKVHAIQFFQIWLVKKLQFLSKHCPITNQVEFLDLCHGFMKMRSPANFLLAFYLFLVPVGFANSSDDEAKKDKIQKEWVVEVREGVKRYGKTSDFAEVGQSHNFDVSPTEGIVAFSVGTGIKLWDVDSKKVVGKLGTQYHQNMAYTGDGTKIVAISYESGRSVVKIYDVITKQVINTIDPATLADKTEDAEEELEDDDEESTEVAQPVTVYIQTITLSPDGDRAALGTGQETYLVDLESGEKLSKIKHQNYSQTLAFMADNQFVDSSGTIFDIESGEKVETLPSRVFGQYLQSIKVNPKNENVVAASQWNQGVILYDLERKKRIDLEMPGKAKSFLLCEFSGNGKLIAGATYAYNSASGKPQRSEIYVWDVERGKLKNRFTASAGQMMALRFSADNKYLYSKAHGEFGITDWDLSEKEQSKVDRGITSPIQKLAFSPDGERVLAAPQLGSGVFIDLETGEPGKSIPCNQAWHLKFDKTGKHAIIGANYNNLMVYNCETNRSKSINVRSYSRPSIVSQLGSFLTRKKEQNSWENYSISDVTVSDDQDYLYAALRGQRNFRFETFEMSTGKNVARKRFRMKDYWEPKKTEDGDGNVYQYSQLQWSPNTFASSPDGSYIAILNDDMNLFVIDPESGDEVHDLGDIGEFQHQSKLSFSRDGSKLIFAKRGELKVWDVESGDEVKNSIDAKGLSSISMSLDGSRIAVLCNHPSRIDIYDDGFEKISSHKSKEVFSAIAISHDGDKIALAKNNCQFEVWDLEEIK